MIYNVRLKTGFFETALYQMTIQKSEILFSPTRADVGEKSFAVPERDILAVSIANRKTPQLEIQTAEKRYSATLASDPNLNGLLLELRNKLDCKIIYEGEKGYE